MENIFRPSGCIVPSLEMISISNCFRLNLAAEHLLRPLTAMSDVPGRVKVPCDRETTSVLLDAPKMFAESFAQSTTGLPDV